MSILIFLHDKDFRPINDISIVDAANTTYSSSDFNPSGVDSLSSDIGAMMNNETPWRAGITWNTSQYDDETYVIMNKLNFYNELN